MPCGCFKWCGQFFTVLRPWLYTNSSSIMSTNGILLIAIPTMHRATNIKRSSWSQWSVLLSPIHLDRDRWWCSFNVASVPATFARNRIGNYGESNKCALIASVLIAKKRELITKYLPFVQCSLIHSYRAACHPEIVSMYSLHGDA